ncbi:hypothetical protein D046_8437B, partial [Vibrio parahaemolyticus V-223/04]
QECQFRKRCKPSLPVLPLHSLLAERQVQPAILSSNGFSSFSPVNLAKFSFGLYQLTITTLLSLCDEIMTIKWQF